LGGDEALFHVVDRVVWIGFVFQRDGAVRREFDFLESLEEADKIQVAGSDDDIARMFLAFLFILDMQRENSLVEFEHGFDRIFLRPDEMARVDTRSNKRVVILDRFLDVGNLVIKRARSMVMNRDANVVLGNKFVEAVE